MPTKHANQRISAVVPAYNEAGRIGAVLRVLTSYGKFREIIVVDDGSTDQTALIASRYDVQIIRTPRNVGKASSMDVGVKAASGDIIFFCDADVRGLTHAMIDTIVGPVCRGEVDMFIGMRNRKAYVTHQLLSLVPLLGGERAVTKKLWRLIPPVYKQRFRIETALNFYARYCGLGFGYTLCEGLKQTIKEKKYGFVKGIIARLRMAVDLIYAQYLLLTTRSVSLHRDSFVYTARNLRGFLLGLLLSLSFSALASTLFFTAGSPVRVLLAAGVVAVSVLLVLFHGFLAYAFLRRWLTITALRRSLYY